jgi:hypothetical protein
MLGWTLWLLGSWAANLGWDGAMWVARGLAGDATVPFDLFVPVARGYVVSILVGLAVVWPMARLSGRPGGAAGMQIALDLVTMLILAQMTLLPLGQLAGWAPRRALMVNLAVGVWALPVGLIVLRGLRGGAASRTGAMAMCVAMAIGPWLAVGLGAESRWAHWSPLHQLWTLASPAVNMDLTAEFARLAAVAGLTMLAAWITTNRRDRRAEGGYHHPSCPPDS